jgi:hypothetical protein
VLEALKRCGREDLIGYGKGCLVRPAEAPERAREGRKAAPAGPSRPPRRAYSSKWAKAKKK